MVARRALPVLIALLPAVVPATASAGIAFRNNGTDVLMLVENGAEVNTMTVTESGGTYTIKDAAGMGAGANCNDANPNDDTVTCPAGAVATINANLGPGDDKFVSTVATPAKVLGGTGADDLTGGSGPDQLIGGPENDTLHGGVGNDTLMGETTAGDSSIGQNTIDGGPGNDTMDGGAGTDAMMGGSDDDHADGGGGPDMIAGEDGNDFLGGGDGNDTVLGGPGNDQVGTDTERGNDVLDAGPDGDVVLPGLGPEGGASDSDSISGGDGTDEVLYGARTTRVVASIDGVANDGAEGEQDDVHGDIERIIGGSAGDELRGSAGDEELRGGAGGDLLAGGAGDDLLLGGEGDDQLDGSAPGLPGAGKGFTSITDKDTLDGGEGNDSFTGGPGADRMIGGPGIDGTSYATALKPVFVTLDGKADDGEVGEGDTVDADVENLGGWRGQDTFTGSGAANAMSSAGGEDYLDGAGGADAMTAGGGFDVVRARDGVADRVDCGGSSDFAILDKSDTVSKSCERVDRGLVKRPRLGRSLLIKPLHGGEAFGLQGMHRFVPLKDQLGLPPGVKLDATQGAVRLTAANAGGHAQSGDFSEGAFLVKQPRSAGGLTELTLTGGSLSKCPSAKGQARAAASHRVVRRLFGRAHGRFRTRGRNSTATVRGTQWTVIDRCDGTLTTVKRGTVVVRDRVKHLTVILKSGERYLARRANG